MCKQRSCVHLRATCALCGLQQEAMASGEYVPSLFRRPPDELSPRVAAALKRGNLLSCLKDISGGVDAALSGCFMKLSDWMTAPPLLDAGAKRSAGDAAVNASETKDDETERPKPQMPGPGARRRPVFGVRPADRNRCILRTCAAHGDSPLLRAAARGDVYVQRVTLDTMWRDGGQSQMGRTNSRQYVYSKHCASACEASCRQMVVGNTRLLYTG